MLEWSEFRNADGSLDLLSAWRVQNPAYNDDASIAFVNRYFERITKNQRIKSRQVASVVLTTALSLLEIREDF